MAKDWKGNSNSGRYAVGMKTANSVNEREQDDFYATDPKALQKLIDRCSVWLQRIWISTCEHKEIVWECACGDGNLAKCLMHNGLIVHASDLKDRHFGCPDVDFLQEKGTPNGCKIILTNPPYSLATEFIEHALDILSDGGLYIAFMNLTYLHGINRYIRVYSKGTLREVYVFSGRIECWKNGIQSRSGNMVNYAWFVFQKGFQGQPTLYWL